MPWEHDHAGSSPAVQTNSMPRITYEWREVLSYDPCVYCGGEARGLDHIQPQSRGGVDNWTNRAPACRKCDNLKGNASLLFFLVAVARAEWRGKTGPAHRMSVRNYLRPFQGPARRRALSAIRDRALAEVV